MGQKSGCFFGPTAMITIIAWFQIVESSIGVMVATQIMLASFDIYECLLHLEDFEAYRYVCSYLTIWDYGAFVLLIVEGMNFFTAIALQVTTGIIRSRILAAWSVITTISILFLLAASIVSFCHLGDSRFFRWCVFAFIFKALTQGFAMWIVCSRQPWALAARPSQKV